MPKQPLEIHSENILPIIKKWLYSDKDIFVRELVSNACDAIHKIKILQDQGIAPAVDQDFRVTVAIDKDKRTIKFIDNGVGMDAEEVQKYISQIAFSGAEDFVSKYQTNQEKDQFIGHFGLGFYSAFMVSEKVEIETKSYKPDAEPVFWSCDGSTDYTIEKGNRTTRGTEITLFIDKDSDEYLEESRMSHILHHYCSFLPYPVYLGDKLINTEEPLWMKAPSECTEKDYLDFYHHLYPMDEDPLFWIHLNVDYPFHLKGILYFPKIRRDYDPNKNTVKLYCNRVFVADNCKDIIPSYLMALRGVIDSPDIPLNVSRSYLQMDRTVRQLSGHISKKVADSLNTLYRNERDRFIKIWDDVSIVVKLGALEDEKFYDRVKDIIIWPTINDEWMTVGDYLERYKDKTKDKVIYTRDTSHLSHVVDIYKQKGIDVLVANNPIDPYLIDYLERKISPASFQRIDAALDEHLLDKDREKTVLDASGRTEAAKLADFVRSKLSDDKVEVEAKSLASDALPGFIMLDENQRRMRDFMMRMDPKNALDSLALMGKQTFVVNTNNPLMSSLEKLDHINPELSKEVVKQTYQMALLSQREMDPKALNEFILRTTHVMEKLAEQAVKDKC
jgi:molecular chaperone HtpG